MLLKLLVCEKMSFWARGGHLLCSLLWRKDKKILWSCMNKKAQVGQVKKLVSTLIHCKFKPGIDSRNLSILNENCMKTKFDR